MNFCTFIQLSFKLFAKLLTDAPVLTYNSIRTTTILRVALKF